MTIRPNAATATTSTRAAERRGVIPAAAIAMLPSTVTIDVRAAVLGEGAAGVAAVAAAEAEGTAVDAAADATPTNLEYPHTESAACPT